MRKRGTGTIDRDGYLLLVVNKKQYKMHRKIYEDFWKIKLSSLIEIHHIDGNRKNNKIGNLMAMTRTDHRIIHGMITKEKAQEILNMFLARYKNHTIKEFEDKMGYCVETITRKLGNWNKAKEACGKALGI
jgi:hypothetical protein